MRSPQAGVLIKLTAAPGTDVAVGQTLAEVMTGVDLSRAFRGRRLPKRPYAWGGYGDSFYIRSERWALWAYNRPSGFKLFDLQRDPGHNHNVASQYPGVVQELYGKVLARAGGRLPYYGV